jgi:HEAT repeat protein
MEHVSKDNPELAVPYLESMIEYIDYDAPRVKWEIARVIANVSRVPSNELARAIPKLLRNAEDSGTVVRWSAAFALTEIAKHNPDLTKELIPKFSKIAKKEHNGGVKKIYLKALKNLTK